jgi:cytochrome c-type biogenesis protein CcmH
MVLFYAVAGALVLATAFVLIRPLITGPGGTEARGTRDARLYRDQLDEIERDLARGTINAGEAEGARAEVSRRLIAATGRAKTAVAFSPAPRLHSRLLAGIALIGAPALAVGLYLAVGMPGQPDLPLAERAAIEAAQGRLAPRPSQAEAEAAYAPGPPLPLTGEQQDYASLMARLETLLEQRPGDTKGLELLATGYMRLGRYADSWRAYERLLAVPGDGGGDRAEAGLYAAMAEAMVQAAGGYVSPAAELAIGEALARDETLLVARYYGGLMMAQNGRIGEAIAVWERVKAETPAGAPWLEFLDRMLAEAKAVRDGAPGPAPSAADIEAAGALSPEQRQEMIEGMVAQLEERLTSAGGSPEEWLRLMNAYAQLGRRDDAARIARLGIAAFGTGAQAGFLREQALVMGLIGE